MKKKMWIAAGIFCAFWVGTAAYAARQSSTTVRNHISTGDINIGIREYEIRDGEEQRYDAVGKTVLPSQKISKIPRITNYANPCYIRVKINFTTEDTTKSQGKKEDEQSVGLSEKDLAGMKKEWKQAGAYYYLTRPLISGESVDVFQSVTIPPWWGEEMSEKIMNIRIEAEAVQAAGFYPDFSSADPWHGTEAEVCLHEENGMIREIQKEYQAMKVIYEEGAERLIAVPGDFFGNLGRVMPGDVLSDTVSLENVSGQEAELFFRTAVPAELNEQEKELLERFELTIHQREKILYSGPLSSEKLQKEPISLGKLKPGEQDSLAFSLRLPKELKNEYALRTSAVDWIFSAFEEETLMERVEAPATGDSAGERYLGLIILTICAAAASIAAGGRIRKKEKQDEEKI